MVLKRHLARRSFVRDVVDAQACVEVGKEYQVLNGLRTMTTCEASSAPPSINGIAERGDAPEVLKRVLTSNIPPPCKTCFASPLVLLGSCLPP